MAGRATGIAARPEDGLITTHESVRSAKLWDSGVRYAFDDNHAFFQYVPMMSRSAWDELPEDLRQLTVDTWEATVDDNRKAAERRQAEARQEARNSGITVRVGTPEQLAAARVKLLAAQPEIVAELGMDSVFVERAQAAIEQSMRAAAQKDDADRPR
jgi:TRAP-type transport system periplasmic protein